MQDSMVLARLDGVRGIFWHMVLLRIILLTVPGNLMLYTMLVAAGLALSLPNYLGLGCDSSSIDRNSQLSRTLPETK
ncbi:hypothetical protein BDV09DRAFT_161112 [Aspergillus tetrazonus]